jgi:hypothetical protein
VHDDAHPALWDVYLAKKTPVPMYINSGDDDDFFIEPKWCSCTSCYVGTSCASSMERTSGRYGRARSAMPCSASSVSLRPAMIGRVADRQRIGASSRDSF